MNDKNLAPLFQGFILVNYRVMDELLDIKQFKKILNRSLPLVYKMADREQIPCVDGNVQVTVIIKLGYL